MKKILFFFILIFSFLLFFERANVVIFISAFSPWYNELSDESRYNHALYLAKEKRDFTGSLDILSHTPGRVNSDTYELMGDNMVMLHQNTDALILYKTALSYGENPRVEKKIQLISEVSTPKKDTGATNTVTGRIIEEKQRELDKIQEERKNYIQPASSQEVFDTLFSSLTGSLKDW